MNAKGDLIARLVSLGLGAPTFEAEAHGPAHERTFHVKVWAGGQVLASAEGRTKKDAERLAAELALRGLDGETAPAPLAAAAQSEAQVWPIYAQVLAEAVEAAMEFAREDATLDDVRRDAGRFYRELLSDLGHGPDEA
ncbi:MAG: putative dsRNA-binding protein [Deinococcus sp.]|uniref:putative dsRNA-binding protein n=1 Tax=Deinococcus sp. TaxID=47478 RepID=UPI0026DA6EC6|nr:putative dsRNA-binding protein [Deinococcus sp.]MDO4245774.1 putative dsRNA-binding protein [Deinococcus sp.]